MMPDSYRALLALILTCSMCCDVHTSCNLSPRQKQDIDEFVRAVMRCRDIAAMNLAVVCDGRPAYTTGYGGQSLASGAAATDENTAFGLASLSKAFSTTLLGVILQKSNRYSWTTPVREILGQEFYLHDTERTLRTTLADLAAHRTGIGGNNMLRFQTKLSRVALARIVRFLKPHKLFRDSYLYNNLMYGLLAHITEKVGGDSWERLMQKHIFEPLNMTQTFFTHNRLSSRSPLAVPYMLDFNNHTYPKLRNVSMDLHKHWGELGGSGSLASTATDMSKWMSTLLGHDHMLPRSVVKQVTTPRNTIPTSRSSEILLRPSFPVSYAMNEYALGWRTGFYRGYPQILHTGTSFGYGALLTLLPSMRMAVHTSITGSDYGYYGRRFTHMRVLNHLLGETEFFNATLACKFDRSSVYTKRASKRSSDKIYTAYTGVYRNHAYGTIELKTTDAGRALWMYYGTLGKWRLHDINASDTFQGTGEDAVWMTYISELRFTRRSGTPFTFTVPDWDRLHPPVFTKGPLPEVAPPAVECPDSAAATSQRWVTVCLIYTVLTVFSPS